MAQPPLSRQVRLLEEETGLSLFDRNTRRVVLTEAGRTLYPEALKVLADVATFERRASELCAGDGGTLRLGFVDSSSYEMMPRFLRAHRSRWPSVDYELSSMSSDEQLVALASGEIDLGIGRANSSGHRVEATILHVERLLIAVGIDHPFAASEQTSIAATADETFIGFDRRISPSLHSQLSALFADHNVAYDPIIEATEYTTILGLVASGQGIAVVPAGVRSFRPADLRYLAVTDDDATSRLLLFSRTDETSPLVRRATELAAELFNPAEEMLR